MCFSTEGVAVKNSLIILDGYVNNYKTLEGINFWWTHCIGNSIAFLSCPVRETCTHRGMPVSIHGQSAIYTVCQKTVQNYFVITLSSFHQL